MIDAAKRFYLERKGHEAWIETLETALADARALSLRKPNASSAQRLLTMTASYLTIT